MQILGCVFEFTSKGQLNFCLYHLRKNESKKRKPLWKSAKNCRKQACISVASDFRQRRWWLRVCILQMQLNPSTWNIDLSHSLSVALMHQSWSLLIRLSYHLGQKLQWSGFCFLWKSQQSVGNSQLSNWSCLLVELAKSPVDDFLDTRFPGALTMPSFASKAIFLKVPYILANVLAQVRQQWQRKGFRSAQGPTGRKQQHQQTQHFRCQCKKRTTLNEETLGIFVPKHVTLFLGKPEELRNMAIRESRHHLWTTIKESR